MCRVWAHVCACECAYVRACARVNVCLCVRFLASSAVLLFGLVFHPPPTRARDIFTWYKIRINHCSAKVSPHRPRDNAVTVYPGRAYRRVLTPRRADKTRSNFWAPNGLYPDHTTFPPARDIIVTHALRLQHPEPVVQLIITIIIIIISQYNAHPVVSSPQTDWNPGKPRPPRADFKRTAVPPLPPSIQRRELITTRVRYENKMLC